jgi:ubiquinone/menaquinone biosynthesis C-methylase UbiE
LGLYDPLVAICTQEKTFKEHLLRQATLPPGARVLDVGCGSGTLALGIVAAHPRAKVTAVDADRRILAQAKVKPLAEQVDWQVGNAVDLGFAADSFDCVFCSLLLHHLRPEEKVAALSEMARVLAPDGQLLLADYCRPASRMALLQFLPVRLLDGWHRTACNVRGRIPGLIRDAGFRNVSETLTVSSVLGTLRCFRGQKEPP